MNIEVEIPDDLLLAAARQCVESLFATNRYSSEQPFGLKILDKACRDEVKEIDFRALVRPLLIEMATKALPAILLEAIRAEAKKVVRDMARDGELLASLKDAESKP